MATRDSSQYGNGNGQGSQNANVDRLATGLGWFSIALGAAELLAPDKVAQLIGVEDDDRRRGWLRFYGVREIAAGIGILSQKGQAGWLWSRVAGDALDLTSLGSAMKAGDANRTKLVSATAAVAGVTALDIFCAQQLSRGANGSATDGGDDGSVRVTKTIIIGRPAEELYNFWHDFNNLGRFMTHLDSVQVTGNGRSHWVANGPGGKKVEWDAEIVADEPGKRIAWRSLEGADVQNSGSVQFQRATGGRGTLVRVELQYAPPGGKIGAAVAKLFRQAPGQQIEDDLHIFKQIIETGEVVKSDASIHSGMHPAQPSAE